MTKTVTISLESSSLHCCRYGHPKLKYLDAVEVQPSGDDDHDHVHMPPRKARSFYQYLRDLHIIDRARRESHA